MKTIWKFHLEWKDSQTIMVQAGAKFLCAKEQRLRLCVWAEVMLENPREAVEFLVVGTGNSGPDFSGHVYLSTVQSDALVWHIYYRKVAA